jgi:hypothetical protein
MPALFFYLGIGEVICETRHRGFGAWGSVFRLCAAVTDYNNVYGTDFFRLNNECHS